MIRLLLYICLSLLFLVPAYLNWDKNPKLSCLLLAVFGLSIIIREIISYRQKNDTKIANRIAEAAAEMRNGKRTGLNRLTEYAEGAYSSGNRKLAQDYISEITDTFTLQYDKDFGSHKVDLEKIRNMQPENVKVFLKTDILKNRNLGSLASKLAMINKIFGTAFRICDLDKIKVWYETEEFIKIINKHR